MPAPALDCWLTQPARTATCSRWEKIVQAAISAESARPTHAMTSSRLTPSSMSCVLPEAFGDSDTVVTSSVRGTRQRRYFVPLCLRHSQEDGYSKSGDTCTSAYRSPVSGLMSMSSASNSYVSSPELTTTGARRPGRPNSKWRYMMLKAPTLTARPKQMPTAAGERGPRRTRHHRRLNISRTGDDLQLTGPRNGKVGRRT